MVGLFVCIGVILFGVNVINGTLQKCPHKTLIMCRCTQNASKYVVDCSNVRLSFVPRGIPASVTHLFLDYNNIYNLKKGSFPKKKKQLKVLSIKHNRMKKIEAGVFQHTPNIQELDLYNNSLEYENSLPEPLFEPLNTSLKILDIRMNMMNNTLNYKYPNSVGNLKMLTELRMDCLRDKPLPFEYSNLKNLKKLIFQGGRHDIFSLGNDIFDTISLLNVSEINLAGLNLRIIGKDTFSKMKMVRKIDLSNNPELGIHLADIAPSLHNTSIRVLNLNNVGLVNTLYSATDILKEFCRLHLEELTLDNNYFHYKDVEPIFSKCFSKLTILSLSDNYVLLGINVIADIMKLKHLVGLNISNQMTLLDIVPPKNGNAIVNHQHERKLIWSTSQRTTRSIGTHSFMPDWYGMSVCLS